MFSKTLAAKLRLRDRAASQGAKSSSECRVCYNLRENQMLIRFNYNEVSQSASSGCFSCGFLSTMIYTICFPEVQELGELHISITRRYQSILMRFKLPDESSYGVPLQICALEGAPSPWTSVPEFSPDLGITNPKVAYQQITRWMDECSEKHSCVKPKSPPLLPTRVLEIQEPQNVRLHISQKEERAHYACLSHCWGDNVPVQTKSFTEQEFRSNIPCHTLPLTFQHAIDMTYRLGVKYLWIDSLCIVQDDLDDWRHEGSRMASIYSQGYITLAATRGSNSNAGFYGETYRNEHDQYYTMNDGNAKPYSIFLREWDPIVPYCGPWMPLLQRAWFFQERLLSPRVVHFANDMLYWECAHFKRNERGIDVRLDQNVYSLSAAEGTAKEDLWRKIVTDYSCCQLTFDKDKLPALQGIAKVVQKDRMCAYYAGLWADTILTDLLWYATVRRVTRNAEYHAPSWSWASRRGPIAWRKNPNNYRLRASIESISTTPAGQDPMGEVTAGTLKLKGKCFHAEIQTIDAKISRLMEKPGSTIEGAKQFAQFLSTKLNWDPDYEDEVLSGQAVVGVLILSALSEAHFLVLAQVNSTEGIFERVGCAFDYNSAPYLFQNVQDQIFTII